MTPKDSRSKAKDTPHVEEKKPVTAHWSSTTLFIFAASGAAIGFNNLWQFPALVAQHGGGAFIVIYLFCVLAIGLPLLITEIMLGRSGRASPVYSFIHLAERNRQPRHWAVVGGVAVLGGFLIFSYLGVIAGWTMAYTLRMAIGAFNGQTADGIVALFTALVRDPEKQLFWHTLFVVMTMMTVARGLRFGLEPVVKYAAPAMFGLLFLLLLYALSLPSFEQAVTAVFAPDFSKLTRTGVLVAMANAFFSIGLGMGAMVMYGAYLAQDASVPRAATALVGIDTVFAILSAMIVFAVLLAGRVEMGAGPALVFQALPLAFDHIPFGQIFGTLFFLLLVLIAWLTAIALVEPAMVWLGERFGLSRFKSALACGSLAWVLGLGTILSFNYWSFSFKFLGVVKKLGFFDVLQLITSQLLLPVGGVLIALFAGWAVSTAHSRHELAFRSPCGFDAWLWSVRVVIPAMLILVSFHLQRLFA